MIQKSVLKASLGILILIASASAAAKSHPYSAEFEQQAQMLFMQGTQVSAAKTDKYIERLQTKRRQIKSILMGAERYKGLTDAEKIEAKIADEASLQAFDIAISKLQSAKLATDQAQAFALIKEALDIEGAIRITGDMTDILEAATTTAATFAKQWKLPKNSPAQDEASNLWDPQTNSYMSQQRIAQLKAAGVDLSAYGPGRSSPFWQAPRTALSVVDINAAAAGKTHDLYRGFEGFPVSNVFDYSKVKQTNTKPKLDLTYKGADGKKHKIKFKLGAELHADPTVSSLMLAMGYPADLTRYVRNVRVNLGKASLSDLKRDWESYFKRDSGWRKYRIEDYILQSGVDQSGQHFVVFKDGLLEAKPEGHEKLGGWKFSENMSLREVRALTFIQMFLDNNDMKEFDNNALVLRKNSAGQPERHMMIADVGHALGGWLLESPDWYAWDMVSKEDSKNYVFSYRAVHPLSFKNKITLADAKWATRLIAGLTRQQIEAAVAQGKWPQCIGQIYTEKIVARRNALVRRFGMAHQYGLLPETQNRTAFSKDVACKNDQAALNAFTSDFDGDGLTILNGFGRSLKGVLLDFARGVVNDKRRWVISPATVSNFNFDTKMVSEIILNFRRDIERNPNPKTEQDLYIVKDQFEVGLRLGVSWGAYKDVIYTRMYTLAYPARSHAEASLNNGFIVNLLLPLDVHQGKLPSQYVLKTEHYLENGAGIDFEHSLSIVSPIIRAGVARVNLWRSILDHRDTNRVVLYRDRSDFTQASLEGLMRIAIIKMNVFKTLAGWGHATGRGTIFTNQELKNSSNKEAIRAAVADGDFAKIQPREQQFEITNEFSFKSTKWNLLFVRGSSTKRLDKVELSTQGDSRDTIQYSTNKEVASGLSAAKRRSKTVQVFVDPNIASKYRINVRVIGSDIDMNDKELGTLIKFANGTSPDSRTVIDFSPELGYTTNGRWGSMLMTSEIEYSAAGVEAILALTTPQLRGAVASAMNMSAVQYAELMKRYKDYLQAKRDDSGSVARTSNSSYLKEFGLTADQVELVRVTEAFAKNLAEAKMQPKLDKRVKMIAEAIRGSLFTNQTGFYDPTILKAMNKVAGLSRLYARTLVTKPPFSEMKTIEEKPIYGEFGTPLVGEAKYLIFSPQGPVELYTMFDSWF